MRGKNDSLPLTAFLVACLLALLLGSCYWQSPNTHGDLAVDVSIARTRPTVAPSLGALQSPDQEFGVLLLVLFDTRFLDDPQALDDAIGGLVDKSLSEFFEDYYGDWNEQPIEDDVSSTPLYRSARVHIADIGSARSGSGSILFSDLESDREYILFGACFGWYYDQANAVQVYVESVGMQAARVQANSTTLVNLALNKDTGQFERFLFDNYGFSDVYPVWASGWIYGVQIGGAALEYRGRTGDGLYRYHVYIFEQEATFNNTATYNQNTPGAGRLDPEQANFVEFLVAAETPGFAAGNTYQLDPATGQRLLFARANNISEGGSFDATAGFLSYTAGESPGEYKIDFQLTLATDGAPVTLTPDGGPILVDTYYDY